MGIALAPSLRGNAWRRAATGQAMIDFSWAAASRGGGRFDPWFMLGATLPSYPCWVGGTVIGVFAGDLIGDPAALGLDVLFPAFFLCILVEGELRPGLPGRCRRARRGDRVRAHPITPAGVPVIAATAAALLGLRGARRRDAADDRRLGDDRRPRGHDRARSAPPGPWCSAAATSPPRFAA